MSEAPRYRPDDTKTLSFRIRVVTFHFTQGMNPETYRVSYPIVLKFLKQPNLDLCVRIVGIDLVKGSQDSELEALADWSMLPSRVRTLYTRCRWEVAGLWRCS